MSVGLVSVMPSFCRGLLGLEFRACDHTWLQCVLLLSTPVTPSLEKEVPVLLFNTVFLFRRIIHTDCKSKSKLGK